MDSKNPFIISGYDSPKYFCDRVNETEIIRKALHNGRDITLISPRRIGKTGLIKNVFHRLREENPDIVTIYMDIYSTRSLGDLIQMMAASILGQLDTNVEKIMNRIAKFIKTCRPVFSFDEIKGKPTVSVDIVKGEEEATLKEIFEYLGSSEKKIYIAIDEFQQINEYAEDRIEALLRSYIQFIPNVNFIFSGSKRHIMQEIFLSAKRPFYQSTQIVSIDVIDREEYYKFANSFFIEKGNILDKEVFEYIYNSFSGHTWYVQAVLNRLYSYSEDVKSSAFVDEIIQQIIDENTYYYQHLLSSYTDNSVSLLKAIAKEGLVTAINSGDFIAKYKLKAASSINTSLTKLVNEELVYKSLSGYIVYDRFMAIWLKGFLF